MPDTVWVEYSWGLFLYFHIFPAIFSLNTVHQLFSVTLVL